MDCYVPPSTTRSVTHFPVVSALSVRGWDGIGTSRVEPEGAGVLCDLLWADPADDPGVVSRSGQVQELIVRVA